MLKQILLCFAALIYGSAFAQTAGHTETEISFNNGPVELSGTILRPEIDQKLPAIVFLHGSGPVTRAGARSYAEQFAKLGIASLFFDKRGAGKSGGNWSTSSLQDLANDGLAAVAWLKQQPDIDSTRIGFWGVSQAAWVATLAASQTDDIAFMVLISGGGASPKASELFSYEQMFNRANLDDAAKAEAYDVLDDYFTYLGQGEGRAALVSRLEASNAKPWHQVLRLERILPSEKNRKNWQWVANWNPMPHMAKLKIPVLLMFGDQDKDQPTELAIKRWREGLAKAGNKDATIMLFPGAGHGIRMGAHHGAGRAPFADGYMESMVGWLWMRVIK